MVRLLAVTLLAVTACSSPSDTTDRQSDTPPEALEHVELPQVAAGPREDGPSALHDMRDQRLPRPLLNPDLIVSGGPPPDGIPPIDEPRFSRAHSVGWLADTEPLLSLTVGRETRGYPLQIMTWHEIVNDTVGGIPIAVTYCPLCNSGVTLDRRAAGRVLSFGTSGRLYADNLVIYDRQVSAPDDAEVARGRDVGTVAVFKPLTAGRHLHFVADGTGFRDRETGSRWDVSGRATSGPLNGHQLAPVQFLDTFWFAWVTFHPDTRVIK
ncbi:MAG: DUF3179 domain-containing protein [Kribbellaceae bacterium]|nr:DUF3179 domain-containing protein [Kribbellaceae bacterium]